MDRGEAGRWQDVLRSAARLQDLVPDAVLVGGTAAALHAGHRVSFDHHHVLGDLRDRFDGMLTALEETDGRVTARARRPVLILGSLDGVETGLRQLIRTRPLEVEDIAVAARLTVRAPTLPEMLRVKAWLVLRRNATRDYLDVAALADRLGDEAPGVLARLDDHYDAASVPDGAPVATQVVRQLGEPSPYDLDRVELREYRGPEPRWHDWNFVAGACADLGSATMAAYGGLPRHGSGGLVMLHRHLDTAPDRPVEEWGLAALDDLLDRGDLADWRPLLLAVGRDPWGPLADRVLHLCRAHRMYGTSAVWPRYVTARRQLVGRSSV